MRRRRLTITAGIAALALAVTACSGDGDGSEADPGEEVGDPDSDIYIALISKGFQHQFWQAVRQGAQDAAEENGVRVTFDGPDSETEVEQQLQQLQTALTSSPSAVGFAALDSEASLPLLQEAESQGVPIVAFDSGVEFEGVATTVATDNVEAAAEAGRQMAELIDGEGDVAVVCHSQTSLNGIQRRDGFVDYLEENAPGVTVVDIQYGDGDQLRSTDITKSILQSNPDLAGIYGCNEGSAIGIVNGVTELDRADGLAVIGFDSGRGQIDAINDGIMDGAITQDPYAIGYETVIAAIAAINGDDLPESIDTGFFYYNADNIEDEEIQRALYD